jgi:predicted nucleic acid-binding protein
LPQALSVIDSLVALESCLLLNPGEKHWEIVRRLCAEVSANGKQVADAQHAALALEHGCTWVTRDGDFERFRKAGLRLEMLNP